MARPRLNESRVIFDKLNNSLRVGDHLYYTTRMEEGYFILRRVELIGTGFLSTGKDLIKLRVIISNQNGMWSIGSDVYLTPEASREYLNKFKRM